MATSRRPGQVRFEAWVPEDLYRAFQEKHRGSRKGWLVAALRAEVWGDPMPEPGASDSPEPASA
jgi:hypothetical protein